MRAAPEPDPHASVLAGVERPTVCTANRAKHFFDGGKQGTGCKRGMIVTQKTGRNVHAIVETDLLQSRLRWSIQRHIHSFPDGNGRIGRILNVLYLTRMGLIDLPVLYLSRHVTQHKADYYRLLQAMRDSGEEQEAWEDWVIYMLEGVAETAATTLRIVEGIRDQMARTKHRMRAELTRLYIQELLDNLFRHPYTRIEYVQRVLGLKARQTAAKYLDALAEHGFVVKQRAGKHNYFIITELVRLFLEVSEEG